MARRTHTLRVPVRRGERRVLCMVEGGAGPRRRVVAGLACSREELGLGRVSRIGCVVVIGLMATDAGGRQRGVVTIHVAVGARTRRNGMRTGQRKRCVVVVKRGIRPDSSVVAQFAGRRESRCGVGGIGRPCIILLMARIAQCAVQRVIVVDMAVSALAWRHQVRARQLESGCAVVESGVRPQNRIVASFAGGRESSRRVVHWRGRVVVVRLMARHAGSAGQAVIVIDVAIRALPRRNQVRSGQCESGAGVVEGCIQPRGRVVALIAALREVCSHVIGIGRSLEIRHVAGHARR